MSKLTKAQREWLKLLAIGPRSSFTDRRVLLALERMGLARIKGFEAFITKEGRRALEEQSDG